MCALETRVYRKQLIKNVRNRLLITSMTISTGTSSLILAQLLLFECSIIYCAIIYLLESND